MVENLEHHLVSHQIGDSQIFWNNLGWENRNPPWEEEAKEETTTRDPANLDTEPDAEAVPPGVRRGQSYQKLAMACRNFMC